MSTEDDRQRDSGGMQMRLGLGTVREADGNYRRESHTSTFGGGRRDGSGLSVSEAGELSASPEPGFERSAAPSPSSEIQIPRPSLSPSDALRHQAILANADPLRQAAQMRSSIEKPEELARDSYDADTRPLSGSYRLTLKTTNDSGGVGGGAVGNGGVGAGTYGYGAAESSNGHSDYKKQYVCLSHAHNLS